MRTQVLACWGAFPASGDQRRASRYLSIPHFLFSFCTSPSLPSPLYTFQIVQRRSPCPHRSTRSTRSPPESRVEDYSLRSPLTTMLPIVLLTTATLPSNLSSLSTMAAVLPTLLPWPSPRSACPSTLSEWSRSRPMAFKPSPSSSRPHSATRRWHSLLR